MQLRKEIPAGKIAVCAHGVGLPFENVLSARLNERLNGTEARPVGSIIQCGKNGRFCPHAARRHLSQHMVDYIFSFRVGDGFLVCHNGNAKDAFTAASMLNSFANIGLVHREPVERVAVDKSGLRLSTLVGRVADAVDRLGIPFPREEVLLQVQQAITCIRKGGPSMTLKERVASSIIPFYQSPKGFRQAEFVQAMNAINRIVEEHDFPLLYVNGRNGRFVPALEISLPRGSERLVPQHLAEIVAAPLETLMERPGERGR